MKDEIAKCYVALKDLAKTDLRSDDTLSKLIETYELSKRFISESTERQNLVSQVPGKSYYMFAEKGGSKKSRPLNQDLFLENLKAEELIRVLEQRIESVDRGFIDQAIYTLAMSFCCSMDILKDNDKKSPGTFFEILIGHMVSKCLGVNPERKIKIPTLDIENTLPTDFVFDLGEGKNRIHLPIKISTRERVVQVWAHQRVLDGMHGVNRFKGLLVCLTETNKQQNKSVVEVCLPGQWASYQMYIAQMARVYYLDIPEKYKELKSKYPFIQVKPFSSLFFEQDYIIGNKGE